MSAKDFEVRSLYTSIASSTILFILQIIVYFQSQITLLLAGAFDSLSDILISIFLLISIFWSRKPPDEYHMFGHGRAQNLASLIVASILIFFLSVETLRSSIPELFGVPQTADPRKIQTAMIISAIAIIAYALPLIKILKGDISGAALKTQVSALVEMEIVFIASLIALFLMQKGFQHAGAWVSTFIGLVIAFTGLKLLADNANFLLGRSPGKDYLDQIIQRAMQVDGVIGVSGLKAEFIGPDLIHAGLTLELPSGTTIDQADQLVKEVKGKIHGIDQTGSCFIQIQPKEP